MIIKNIKIIKKNIKKNYKIVIIFFLIFALLTILFLFKRYSGFSVGAPTKVKRDHIKKTRKPPPPARRVEKPSSHRGSLPPINIKRGKPPVSIDPRLDPTNLGSSQVQGQPQGQLEPRRAGGDGRSARRQVSPQMISNMSSNIDAIFEKSNGLALVAAKLGHEARSKYTKGYQEGTPEFNRRVRAFNDIWNDKLKEFKEQDLPEPVEEELGPQPEPEALSPAAAASEVRPPEQPRSQRRGSFAITTANMTVGNLRDKAEFLEVESRLPNSRAARQEGPDSSLEPRDFNENRVQQDEIDKLKLKQIVAEFNEIDQTLSILLERRNQAVRGSLLYGQEFRDSNNEIKKHIKTLNESDKKVIYDKIKKYYSSAEIENYKRFNSTKDEVLVSLLVDIVNPHRTYTAASGRTSAPRKAYMVNNPGLSSTNGAAQPELTSGRSQSGVSFKYDNTALSSNPNFRINSDNLNAIINITSPIDPVTDQSIGGDGKWERNLETATQIVGNRNLMMTILATNGLLVKRDFAESLNLVVDDFSPRKFLHKPAYKEGEFGGPWNKKHETAIFSSTTNRASGWRKTRKMVPKRIPFLDIQQERSRNAAKFKTLFEAINNKPQINKMKNLLNNNGTDNTDDRKTRFSVAYVAKLADQGYIPPITLKHIMTTTNEADFDELTQLVVSSVQQQKNAMRAVSVGDTATYARIIQTSNQEFLQIRSEYDAIPSKFKNSDGNLKRQEQLPQALAAEMDDFKRAQATFKRYQNKLEANELLKNIGNQQIGTIGSLQIDTGELEVALEAIFTATDQISQNKRLKPKTERSVEKLRESSQRVLTQDKYREYMRDVQQEGIFRRQYASYKIFEDFQKESKKFFEDKGITLDGFREALVNANDEDKKALNEILAESMYVYTFERYQLDSVIGEKKNQVKKELERLPVPDDDTNPDDIKHYLDLNRRFFYLSNLPTQINRNLAPEQLYNIAEAIVRDDSPDVTGMESLIDYKGNRIWGSSPKKQAAVKLLKHSVLGLAVVGGTMATGGGALAGIATYTAVGVGAEVLPAAHTNYKTTTRLGVSRNPTDANGSFESRIEKPKKQKFFLIPPPTRSALTAMARTPATQMGGGMNDAEALFTPTLDPNLMDEMNAAGTVGNFITSHTPGSVADARSAQAEEVPWNRRRSITIEDALKIGMLTPGGVDESIIPISQDQLNPVLNEPD